MQSRLLVNLIQQAESTRDPQTWARAMCRAASHLGRLGHVDEALDAIARVRNRFAAGLSAPVGAWLMLAEGVTQFSQDRAELAFDRIGRAYAIAAALGGQSARPAAAAWLALMEFHSCRFTQMASHLEEALAQAAADDHHARARACLVLADALHFAGDFAAAAPWYEKTRLHATAEGDLATVSAMLHNVAAFRINNIRIADAFGEVSPKESKRAAMEAASALNFDIRLGTASFPTLVPLLQAQLLTVERRHREAEAVLRGLDPVRLERKSLPLMLADLGWCCAAQGRTQEGERLADQAAALLSDSTDPDDEVHVRWRLAQIAERSGDLPRAARCREASTAALGRHRARQAELRARLEATIAVGLQSG